MGADGGEHDAGIGSVVGGYRIVELIGRGSTSAVYAAQHPRLPRRDAVKVLSPDLVDNPLYCKRFRREAEVAALLEHPSVVPVYDVGDGDRPWLAMKYLARGDAERWNDRWRTRRPIGAVLAVVDSVAEGLDHAHRHGVIHRDVRPRNILLREDPAAGGLLADFGTARTLDSPGAGDRNGPSDRDGGGNLNEGYAVHGAAGYAAPELILGTSCGTARSDQYSLAATAFRMLTGELPFYGDSVAALVAGQLSDSPVSAHALDPRLAPAVDRVFQAALDPVPSRRLDSCGALAYWLRAAVGAPALTGSPSLNLVEES